MTKHKAGWTWMVCLAFLGVYDLWAIPQGHESASGAFVRVTTDPKTRIPAWIFIAVLLKHLCAPKVLPQTDPFRAVAKRLREDSDGIDYMNAERVVMINDRMAQNRSFRLHGTTR